MTADNELATLDSLQTGDTCQIVSVSGDKNLQRRLMEIGFRAGVECEVLKSAPFGDPVVYRIGESDISIRREEAHKIRIRLLQHRLKLSHRIRWGRLWKKDKSR